MTLHQPCRLHHTGKGATYGDLDRAAVMAADRNPLDHAAPHLAELRRVSPKICRKEVIRPPSPSPLSETSSSARAMSRAVTAIVHFIRRGERHDETLVDANRIWHGLRPIADAVYVLLRLWPDGPATF